ncbi:MAG: gamma-glutamylcyclotransferase [Verrucomicrobia bacterium]|nr:gamma-glutamylcyclotransferase [Verrucomicrobiota bacterium]
MKQRIFIYGTLKRGDCNARYMATQDFIGEASTEPIYRMVDGGGYPGMFPVNENGVSVLGEVWDVDESCRERLDVLEDVAGGEYEVALVRLLAPFDGQEVLTYIFLRVEKSMPDVGTVWRE